MLMRLSVCCKTLPFYQWYSCSRCMRQGGVGCAIKMMSSPNGPILTVLTSYGLYHSRLLELLMESTNPDCSNLLYTTKLATIGPLPTAITFLFKMVGVSLECYGTSKQTSEGICAAFVTIIFPLITYLLGSSYYYYYYYYYKNKLFINFFRNPISTCATKNWRKHISGMKPTVDCTLEPIQRSGIKHSLGKVISHLTP